MKKVAREEETAEGTDTEAEIDIDFDKMNASAVALLHVIAIGAAGLAPTLAAARTGAVIALATARAVPM